VRVTAGAEFEALTALGAQMFLKNSFAVTANSDRMGFRLAGEPLHLLADVRLVSSAVDFGTIQLLPDGQMIILMADHQTTGGYPRIAHVARIDLPLVAQLNAGDKVYFKLIPLPEAEDLILEREKDLNLFKTAIKLKN
jgi:antagonist of KipI